MPLVLQGYKTLQESRNDQNKNACLKNLLELENDKNRNLQKSENDQNKNACLNETGFVQDYYSCFYKEQLDEIEHLMTKNIQIIEWPEEYATLEDNLTVSRSSELFQFNPFMDNHIIKMKTRLEYSLQLPEQTKFPTLLPKECLFSDLIIIHEHESNNHSGPEQTRRLVRNKYWIIGGKRKIASVLKKCKNQECRMKVLKPVAQQMAPLPLERSEIHCWRYISIDALGPLEMRLCAVCNYNTLCADCEKKKSAKKKNKPENCEYKPVYVLLFADMVSRGVTLELLQDRTTESVLMAFTRMTAVRSTPSVVLSDNAGELVAASKSIKEIIELINSEEIQKRLGERGISWRFTPAVSPSHNGLTEILIKSAKSSLYKTFKGKRLTETELTTAIKQAEGCLNSRALIAISDDKDDNNLLTLTPNHIDKLEALVPLPSSFDQLSLNSLRKIRIKTRWDERKRLQRNYFLRFQSEYLDSLKKRTKNIAEQENIRKGDVVLMLDQKITRLKWPIARVEEPILSRDGKVRSCWLRLPIDVTKEPVSNKRKRTKPAPKFVKRGIEQLCLLEGSIEERDVIPSLASGDVESIENT